MSEFGKKKIAVLASGGGSNLQALIDATKEEGYPAEIVLVISDKESAKALQRAKDAGIEAVFLDPKAHADRQAFDRALVERLEQASPDFICLAGFMRILTSVFIERFSGRVLNIHPSLLPKHGGKGMYGHHVHESVIKAGDSVSGATVHWVEQGIDTGPVILQGAVPVESADSAETLAQRVLALEHRLYPEALRRVCAENA